LETTTINIDEFAAALGLNQRSGETVFGRCFGFPTGLKVIDPLGAPLLLFHVRYPAVRDTSELTKINYEPEVTDLISAKKLEIDLEERLGWVSFSDGARHLVEGSIIPLLKSVLKSLQSAGLLQNPKLCHYCERQEVESVSCIDDKVAQICSTCLEERRNSHTNRPAEATEGAVPIVTLGIPATLVGSLGWALFWIGYFLVFEWLNTDKIMVPRIVEVFALACVGCLTGGPIGYVIRRVQRRGQALSVVFSSVCSITAVLIGEVVVIGWMIYREFHVISPGAALKILPQVELDFGVFHLLIKLLAAVLAVVVAVQIAKPPKPKLNL